MTENKTWWAMVKLAWLVMTAVSGWYAFHGHDVKVPGTGIVEYTNYSFGWRMVFIAMLAVVILSRLFNTRIAEAKIRIVSEWRSRQPGRVPLFIPRPDQTGYSWLARNQYGVIDMSKYTPEQWRDSGLPFCSKHMQGAWDNALVPMQGYDGSQWLTDRCDCGMLLTIPRVEEAIGISFQHSAETAMVTGAVAGYLELRAIQRGNTGDSGASGAASVGMGIILAQMGDRRRLRYIGNHLLAHPELRGMWVPKRMFKMKMQPILVKA